MSLKNESSLLKQAIVQSKNDKDHPRKVPLFVTCAFLRSMDDVEDKLTAGTLNDVLMDVPETLHFADLVPHILTQLRLNKEDTFIVKGGYKKNLVCMEARTFFFRHGLVGSRVAQWISSLVSGIAQWSADTLGLQATPVALI